MLLADIRIERNPLKFCIVGGGPAGLAALKIVLDTPQFQNGEWVVTVYEARSQVGGVWLPALPIDDPPVTPLYDSLTTNLPHPVMAYTNFSFPPETPVYPRAHVVETYLQSYAKHFNLYPHIQFNTSVDAVERVLESGQWKVKLSTGEIEIFDFLAVCNGHYRIPRLPTNSIPGLAKWLDLKKAIHSSWYRHPDPDYGNNVLVIGAGPSGQDISSELAGSGATVIHSVRGALSEDFGKIKRRGLVVELGQNGQVLFEDGTVEKDVAFCILATGYKVDFPFFDSTVIQQAFPPPIPPIPQQLYNSSYHVFPLAKHMFPLDGANTNVAFLGLLVRVAPFPLLEAQARAMVHVFANPGVLDSTREAVDIVSRYTQLSAKFNSEDPLVIAHEWHRFEPHEQFDYRDELYGFANGSVGIPGKIIVPAWEKRMYYAKNILREFWVDLEKKGLADEWVKGVGLGGPHEWIELLEKMLKEARKESGKIVEDPYHAVQQEIQTSLQTAGQLRASYVRIRNMARDDSEELAWARNELKATLAALEADLEDLEDSVKIVETTGPRMFGLEESEVQERRRYVAYVRREVESMRAELNAERSTNSRNPSSYNSPRPLHSGQNTPRLETGRDVDEDHQEAWAREEQQLMIQEQDRTMESIAGTLSTLAQQAGLMGQEIGEHNEMLDDLERGVDRTDGRLSDAMRKLRKFARQSEARGSGWCIVILIVVLMVLLLVAILI
ncbi:hypothetical protein GYMLUDRAFT_54123 [Collybiopsis luxurians FD-317 M1]|nr:hypothetical protein GYMLUDRAFT_54123 [Collybiopsis luxurians FD-317 M1]